MSVFNIQNIECRYPNSNHSVLAVEELQVLESEVVFIIGASGVGKSTILETLGLMNNTIRCSKKSKFQFHSSMGRREDFLKMWNTSEKYRSEFRKSELSFIFQNTNLFNTVTALDNVLLPLVLNSEKYSEVELLNEVLPILQEIFDSTTVREIIGNKKKVDDSGNVINDRHGNYIYEPPKKITQLSGGQRQRLAFVRAIASKFSVLFADEPTGNLDAGTADTLMKLLVNYVKNNNSTSIIVSHDIDLAVKHADKIVYIEKSTVKENDSVKMGLISNNSIYLKSDSSWFNPGTSKTLTTKQLIKEFTLQLNQDSK